MLLRLLLISFLLRVPILFASHFVPRRTKDHRKLLNYDVVDKHSNDFKREDNHSNDAKVRVSFGDDDYYFEQVMVGPFRLSLSPIHTPLSRSDVWAILDKLESKIHTFMKKVSFLDGASYYNLKIHFKASDYRGDSAVVSKLVSPPVRRRSLTGDYKENLSDERILYQESVDTTVLIMEGITFFFYDGTVPSNDNIISLLEESVLPDGSYIGFFDKAPLHNIEEVEILWGTNAPSPANTIAPTQEEENLISPVAPIHTIHVDNRSSDGKSPLKVVFSIMGAIVGLSIVSLFFVLRRRNHINPHVNPDDTTSPSTTTASSLAGINILFRESWSRIQGLLPQVEVYRTPTTVFVPPHSLDNVSDSDITLASEEDHTSCVPVIQNILPPILNNSLAYSTCSGIYSDESAFKDDPNWDPDDASVGKDREDVFIAWKALGRNDMNPLAPPTSGADSVSENGAAFNDSSSRSLNSIA